MFGQNDNEQQNIAFLLVNDFSMIALTSAIEPLRTANRLSGKLLYKWQSITINGDPAIASNGIAVTPDCAANDRTTPIDALFVCAGLNPDRHTSKKVLNYLRKNAFEGTPIGGLCTGTIALAKAGLLDDRRCTIHWENVEGLLENYPKLKVTATLFEIDRNRYTCSRGTAPIDMMIYSIAKDHGSDLANQTAEGMLHTNIRPPSEYQRMSLEYRTGITHPKLLAAIAFIEAHLETPLTIGELANSVALSPRQLERLFRERLGNTPKRYYNELRLKRAQLLLQQTSLSIMQVAVIVGYTSASHFTHSYKEYVGHCPKEERLNLASAGSS